MSNSSNHSPFRSFGGSVVVAMLMAFLLLTSCSRTKSARSDSGPMNRALSLPAIPDSISDEDARLHFLLERYWDNMPWQDPEAMADTAFFDQTTVNYLDLLGRADSIHASSAYLAMLTSAPARQAARIDSIAEQYLFNPESPLYSPGLFLVTVDAKLSLIIEDNTRPMGRIFRENASKLLSLKEDLMKNRPGHPAADFPLTLLDGSTATLSSIASRQDETLLIFYDTDCNVCKDAMKRIGENENIIRRVQEGTLRILAVDAFGSDRTAWKKQAVTMPSGWVVGRAPIVDEDDLYLLKATPTIYVIGRDMTVIAQDIRL